MSRDVKRPGRFLVTVALGAAALSCSLLRGRPGGDDPAVPGPQDPSVCDAPGLTWKTGSKTNYTSYPEPGSEECIVYSGCKYEGRFSACPGKQSIAWVKAQNIAAFFPDFASVRLHDLCIRAGGKTMVVTVYDTCADSDCNGCCTRNQGQADALIDLESFTNARFSVPDGPVTWADLGPTKAPVGCQTTPATP
jgi:hypothetical protein